MNFKKIGVPILALIAIVVGLMRNLDTTTIVGNQVTEQTTEQNSNTEVVDFELNNEKTGGKKDNLQPRNVEVSLSHKPVPIYPCLSRNLGR